MGRICCVVAVLFRLRVDVVLFIHVYNTLLHWLHVKEVQRFFFLFYVKLDLDITVDKVSQSHGSRTQSVPQCPAGQPYPFPGENIKFPHDSRVMGNQALNFVIVLAFGQRVLCHELLRSYVVGVLLEYLIGQLLSHPRNQSSQKNQAEPPTLPPPPPSYNATQYNKRALFYFVGSFTDVSDD